MRKQLLSISCLVAAYLPQAAFSDENEELAKKLANPIANLVSVPLQFNHDSGYGTEDADRTILNIQPVIPFTINEEWNLISRTILPVIDQEESFAGQGDETGIGDVLESLWFSPSAPTANGIIWGVGPAALLPTASDDKLGAEKWGLGPTAIVLKQNGPWTIGGLTNHIWSVAGEDDRDDVSSTFLQPFINYTTKTAATFFLNTESTYDWKASQWSVPINMGVNQLFVVGSQRVQLGLGARYWAEAPKNGAEGWGLRVNVVFLFPKA